MAIVQTGLTLDEFLRQPEEKPALEYVDGVVTRKMSPKGPHGRLQLWAGKLFDNAAGEPPRYLTFTELRTNWTDRASLIPDISVYLIERVPTTPEGDIAEDFWLPPDIAVEIASPGQSVNEQTTRANLLLRHGVPVVILVEPRHRRVRLARPGRPIVSYQSGDVVTIEDILPGFALRVDELFSALKVHRPKESGGPST